MQRASSSRARRTPTTSASSTCVSSYAGEWRQRSRPLSCSTCCSRAARTCAIYDVARTRALLDELASGSGRMPSADDLRREITRANAAREAARRLIALRRIVPRVTGTEVFPLLASFWEMEPDRYVEMASDAASRIAARPPLAGPRVLLTGAPVDGHDTARGHRIARRRRRCRNRPVGKRRRRRRRAHRRRPGCRARRQVSSRLDRCAHTR